MNPQPIPASEHWLVFGLTAGTFLTLIVGGIMLDAIRLVRAERRAQARANHPTAHRRTR